MTRRTELYRRLAAGMRGDRAALAELDRQRAAELAALDAEILRVQALREFSRAVARGEQRQ